MVNVYRSDTMLGNLTCVENDPCILHLRDHVYCPSGTPGCVPALYDHGRKIVHQSFYSRGPIPAETMPTCSMSLPYNEVKEVADDETYIFLGEVHNHFGHFLLSTLSRLWNIRSLPDNLKIIINAGASQRVHLDHVRRLLNAFGVDINRFWTPKQPTKLRNVILPCPCFEERNFAHAAFGSTYNEVGDLLTRGIEFVLPGSGPIYLSKSKLVAGVRKIINEEAVEERLSTRGYTIVYPETLPLEQQIALWRLGRPVVAFNGSSLHTSAFSPNVRMISFSWDRFLDSSFCLCDWANGSQSDYFYFEEGALYDHGPAPDHNHGTTGMTSRLEYVDPVGASEAICRAVDRSLSPPRGNAALGRPTSQSSVYVEGWYDASQLSATSGMLSGRYSFCTEHEENPWWQVDLEDHYEIDRVVLFNRTDSALDRASHIHLLLSEDNSHFDLVYARNEDGSFGGLNGQPCHIVLEKPYLARWVKLTIVGPDFLHLDQVEVYGRIGSRK